MTTANIFSLLETPVKDSAFLLPPLASLLQPFPLISATHLHNPLRIRCCLSRCFAVPLHTCLFLAIDSPLLPHSPTTFPFPGTPPHHHLSVRTQLADSPGTVPLPGDTHLITYHSLPSHLPFTPRTSDPRTNTTVNHCK